MNAQEVHKAAKREAMDVFLAPKFDMNDSKVRDFREELKNRIKQLYEFCKQENFTKSGFQCEQVCEELCGRIENKLNVKGSYRSFDQLADDWDAVRRAYMQKTSGPAQSEVLCRHIFRRMTNSVQSLWQDLECTAEAAKRSNETAKNRGASPRSVRFADSLAARARAPSG